MYLPKKKTNAAWEKESPLATTSKNSKAQKYEEITKTLKINQAMDWHWKKNE